MIDVSWAEGPIRGLGEAWLDDPDRPSIDEEGLRHWDELIGEWVHTNAMPLPIRGGGSDRRGKVERRRGVDIVYVDNSPAQWIFARAVIEGWRPGFVELAEAVRDDMPVAMVLSIAKREKLVYNRALTAGPSTQVLGYSLHHKEPVASGRRSVAKLSAAELRERAHRLMSPRNMFVLPLALRGLGELPAFLEVMRTEHMTCRGSAPTPPAQAVP